MSQIQSIHLFPERTDPFFRAHDAGADTQMTPMVTIALFERMGYEFDDTLSRLSQDSVEVQEQSFVSSDELAEELERLDTWNDPDENGFCSKIEEEDEIILQQIPDQRRAIQSVWSSFGQD
ncbi:hypothetical protein N7456_005596 [Penicillium angulare]|uniref:Uncharacterized protein n=1 Tax=Penicillium angulare TaxID=116970 RepID=A0A9W9FYU3_9EURO|nr:hypothetical protein N7456_005596 [Penicillium angulare]